MNDQLRIKDSTRSRSLTKQAIQRLHPIEQTEKIMRSSMKDHAQRLEDEQGLIREHHEELDALKRSIRMWQNNYLSLFSASPTGFLTVYADKTIKEVNPALTAMLNLSSLDMLGRSLMDFAADRQSVGIADYIDGVFAGLAEPFDIMLKRKDGTAFPAMLSSALIKEDDQVNSFCLCAVTDLSELKQNRDEKDNLQQQIKDELERTVTDQMRTIKLLNSRCDETAKLIQSRFDQTQTLKDSLNTQSQVNSELRERIISVENKIADRTGKLESTGNKLKDEVQKRRQLAIDLANIKEVSTMTEQHALTGSWQMDVISKQFVCSDQFYHIFGLKPQIAELSLTDIIDAVETDDREMVRTTIENAISDKTQFDIAHRIVQLEGTVIHVRTRGEFVTQDGKLAIIGTIIDTTEQTLIKHDLDTQCSRLNDLSEQLSVDLTRLNEKLENIKISHKDEIGKLNRDLDRLQKSLDEKSSEILRLETDSKAQAQQSEKLQTEYDDLQGQLEAKTAEIQEIESVYEVQSEKYQKLESEFAWLSHEHETLIAEKSARMNDLVEQLQKQREKQSRYISRSQARTARLKKQLTAVSDDIDSTTKQLSEQREKADHAVTSLDACQNLLAHLSESIPFTLSIYDRSQCRTICVSEHLGRQLGYSHRQIERLGEDFYADLIHPDDVIRMADELDGFEWEGYDGVLESQFRIKAADDSWRHIKAVELVFDKQQKGGPVEILTAHIDITQQKHTEQTIRDLQGLLAEKHAQLDDIFNCVSAARNS